MVKKASFASLADVVEFMMKEARKEAGVAEVEAYASRNRVTISRIETLRHGGVVLGPDGQSLSTLNNCEASVRVVVKNAVGFAATNYLTHEALRRAVSSAVANARLMRPDTLFSSLGRPVKWRPPRLPADRDIQKGDAGDTIMDQVEAALGLLDDREVRGTGSGALDLAGSVMAVTEEVSVANTRGIDVPSTVDTFSVAQLTAEQVRGGDVLSSGMGWSSGRFVKQMSGEQAALDALELARLSPSRKSVPEGRYNVVLGPYAVADIIDNMISPAVCLRSVYVGGSWLPTTQKKGAGGRQLRHPALGTKVAADSITLHNDPTIPGAMASKSFDDEGLPTRRTPLIENGVWTGVLSSTYTAYMYGMEPAAAGFRFGPVPGRIASSPPDDSGTNFVMKPGDMTVEELVEKSREMRGPTLLIPRTWYTYPLRVGGTGFSSSNRSTAFIFDKGELVPVAPNAFKLIGDVAEMLKGVFGVGKDAKVATTWAASAASIVPHIATTGLRVEKPREENVR